MESLMTISEVAALLSVPESWIYGRTARKCTPGERIPHLKIGRHLRFERSKVVEWGEKRAKQAYEASVSQPEGKE